MYKRRLTIVLAIVLASSLILGACGDNTPAPAASSTTAAAAGGTTAAAAAASNTTAAASSGPVTIRYQLWEAAQQPAYQACADAFTKQNPNITVKIEQLGWADYWSG